MDYVQQVAKLCVGMVQDWITFELALGIHYVNGNSVLSDAARAKMRRISQVLFSILAVALLAFAIATIVTAHEEGNHGYAFYKNICLFEGILGWSFFGQVMVMVLLVIWIFVEIRRFEIREKKIKAEFVTDLWKYKRYFAISALFFGLSYAGRFINNIYGYDCGGSH